MPGVFGFLPGVLLGREWLRERLLVDEDGGAESGNRLLSRERDLSLEEPPW